MKVFALNIYPNAIRIRFFDIDAVPSWWRTLSMALMPDFLKCSWTHGHFAAGLQTAAFSLYSVPFLCVLKKIKKTFFIVYWKSCRYLRCKQCSLWSELWWAWLFWLDSWSGYSQVRRTFPGWPTALSLAVLVPRGPARSASSSTWLRRMMLGSMSWGDPWLKKVRWERFTIVRFYLILQDLWDHWMQFFFLNWVLIYIPPKLDHKQHDWVSSKY